MELFNDFFHKKAELLSRMGGLCRKYSLNAIATLKTEKDKANFLSKITELQFGLFFDKIGGSLQYERNVSSDSPLTPDWIIKLNSQSIIAEVGRLNPAKEVQDSSNIEEALAGALQEIKQSYYVKVEFEMSKITSGVFNINKFKNEVEDWLSTSKEIHDQLLIFGIITLTIVSTNTKSEHVCYIGDVKPIKEKPSRLKGDNSILVEKVKKYAPIAEACNLPLIICIYFHFENWFDSEDLFNTLYGYPSEFDGGEEFEEYYPGAPFHSLNEGFYYSNETFKRNVSGILLKQNDRFSYFHNYFNLNRLKEKNAEIFLHHSFTFPS